MNGKLRNMTGVYITRDDKFLLLYRQGGRVVNEVWVASAGGHFEESELNDAQACVLREMKEELGISEKDLKSIAMRYVTLRRTENELRLNYYFFAELQEHIDFALSSNEGALKWFQKSELSTLEMPYTAKYVLEHYLNVGAANSKMYCGVADGEQMIFTELPAF